MNEQPHPPQTAPIDEYRVLWTTQKKQKLKKWHDGFLRFHKFNRRMLVYDDARHLVADMYLRGQDAIGEGDDLEFENHLVTIEDFKGTVVQDLTPLFSPAIQRKQQIQAGNVLLNSPTPNQANRHGPWGPSRYGVPNPQSGQQRRPIPAAESPQTPVQRRPIGVPGLTLQQAARQGINYPAPGAPVNVARPPPRELPSVSHQPPQQNLPQSPIRAPRPRLNPVPPAQRLLFHDTDGRLSPGGRLNPPRPPSSLQTPEEPSPRPNHAPSRPPQLRPNRRPFIALNLDSDPGPIQFQPDIRHPVSPQKQAPAVHPKNAFLRHVPPRPNTFGATVDTDCGLEKSELQPILLTSAEPAPPSRQNNMVSDPAPPRVNGRSSAALKEIRPFRLPSKRKSSGTQPGFSETLANKNDEIVSELGGDGDNEPVFEPLVSAGTLRLNNTTRQKRNKLLCQRPSDTQTAVQSAVPLTKGNITKKPRMGFVPKSTSLLGDVMVIDNEAGPGDKPVVTETSTVNRRKSSNTFQPPKIARKSTESRENAKRKEKASGPSLNQGYRVEEEDTLQYQQDNDIGPWSSEALDLFGWRPPGIKGRK